MTGHKCFNCDGPAVGEVNRLKPPALRKFICTAPACWQAWWALTDKREASRV